MTGNLLTETDLAELLQTSVKTIQDWRYKRQGPPFVKAGRLVRYSRDAVDQWLARETVQPLPPLRSVRGGRRSA